MPHDIKGRLIQLGDVIKVKPVNTPKTVIGVVASMTDNEFCTGQVRWIGLGKLDEDYFGAQESELILKADGTEVDAKEKESLQEG